MIAWMIVAAYVGSGLLLARRLFRSLRPLTVAVSCDYHGPYPQHHEHYSGCYRQPGWGAKWMVDDTGEAVVFALLGGLLWPFFLVCIGLRLAVVAGNGRQRPDEMRARIRELEGQLGMKRSV